MKTKEWLKSKRLELGLTQKELAQHCLLSLPAIAKIESGERLGSIETWEKIEYFLGNDEPKISYDSNELLENISNDILELGEDAECYLIYKVIGNSIVFTYYILKDDEELPFAEKEDVKKEEKYLLTTLKYAQDVLKAQNKYI